MTHAEISEPLATLVGCAAYFFHVGRLSEARDTLAAEFEADVTDVDALAEAARRLYKLEHLSCSGMIDAYLAAYSDDPLGTCAAVWVAKTWPARRRSRSAKAASI